MVTYGSLPFDNFSESRKTVLALGLFDGVHRGHRRVIESAAQMAEESGAALGIFTFSVLKSCPDKKQGQSLITPQSVKHKLFRRLKVEYVFEPDFSEIKQINAREFINDILINRLGAVGIACGYDFHFGAGAKADCDKLCEYAAQAGRRALVTPPQLAPDGAAISSTGIRKLIKSGEIRRANGCWGIIILLISQSLPAGIWAQSSAFRL